MYAQRAWGVYPGARGCSAGALTGRDRTDPSSARTHLVVDTSRDTPTELGGRARVMDP